MSVNVPSRLALCALLIGGCAEYPSAGPQDDASQQEVTDDASPNNATFPRQDGGASTADSGVTSQDPKADASAPTPDSRAPSPDTTVDQGAPAAAACNSCHGDPPSSGRHGLHVDRRGYGCNTCHKNTVDSNDEIISGGAHQNGKTDVKGSFSWDGSRCSNISCHGSKSW